MSAIIKSVVVAVVSTVASYYAGKWVTKLLEEKPLKDRWEDGKTKVINVQTSAMDKITAAREAATAHIDKVVDKATTMYQGAAKPETPAE